MLIRHEGLKRQPYRDSAGVLTIGVGHNMQANPLPPGTEFPLSVADVMSILFKDIGNAEDDLVLAFDWFPKVDRIRQAALTDMCFNLGITKLMGFTTFLKLCAAGNWAGAAEDMLGTLWAKQVGPRALELSTMLQTGNWAPP
jgi:lysozyme